MSVYGDYIKERLNDEIIERDEGFATYRYLDHDGISSVYIVDIYVRPDFRKTKVASEMADSIVEKAMTRGCKRLLGTVVPSASRSTDSLKVLIGYGMDLISSAQDMIVFKKEI